MAGALTAGGVAIAAADLCLAVVAWRRLSVLAGLLGLAGVSLVGFAIASGTSSSAAEGALAIALILTIVGAALYALGHLFERLLDDDPENGDRDAGAER
ncbi:MAG: hypothetical protein JO363_19975 [Solirubrobacterales bacterium]|nr:hypothetical protein [Solirubrobacterales bacterium]